MEDLSREGTFEQAWPVRPIGRVSLRALIRRCDPRMQRTLSRMHLLAPVTSVNEVLATLRQQHIDPGH
jgi:hypothetical protein